MICHFCKSADIRLAYRNKYHPVKQDHGPFNFYKCRSCGSGLTYPVASKKALYELYNSFEGGMSGFTRALRDDYPLNKWYKQCVVRCIELCGNHYNQNAVFKWIDVGAGKGEVTKILSEMFPNSRGTAVDFHDRPEMLSECKNVEWISVDLNNKDFLLKDYSSYFDIAITITVLEHVLYPTQFVGCILNLLKPGGSVYLTCPDMGSIAAKSLRGFWPYLIWGEHLNIPTKHGMHKLIETVTGNDKALVNPVIMPYPINYYLANFKLKIFTFLFTNSVTLPVNTGILEAVIKRPKDILK